MASGMRSGQRSGFAGAPGAHTRWTLAASRATVGPALLAFALIVVVTGIYYGCGRPIDAGLWWEQRVLLRGSIAGLRSLGDPTDPLFIRSVGHGVVPTGLRPLPRAREIRPAPDQDGRITGVFTRDRKYPMPRTIQSLLSIGMPAIAALIGLAAFLAWRLKRARVELRRSEEAARRAADEDKLTGLSNHAKTLELLDLALAERRPEEVTTFALIGLDGMADVNASRGVLASDELTVAVARRLKESLPPQAMCGRIGSDEFAVTLTTEADFDAEAAIRAAIAAITRPHWIDTVVRVGALAGFAQAPRHAETRGELTRQAELALRDATRKSPGCIVAFDPAIDATSDEQKFIQRELPRALSANDLDVHYQPIVSSQDRRVVGVEARLRWTHPSRGPIGPASFIPVAEQMGLMDQLGAFVLRRALAEADRLPGVYVAVNLSPLQVRDRGIVDLVRSALAESGVPAARLMLEITEGVLIEDPEESLRRIEDLHALGVRIALDDFGSGYSNLSYLHRFPLDKLKIDRSFVAALGQSVNGGVIIQAVVALGRALGLSVLVEGVETEEQCALLRLAGCDEMQGFLFARPASAKAIEERLKQQGRAGALPEPLTA
jgi:diguanylate cyclase (GGDEF)-like protein